MVAMLAIAVATLTPAAVRANLGTYDPRCPMCGPLTGIDLVGNLLLFAPLGIGLAIAGVRRRTAVWLGAGLSLVLELLQLTVVPGRDPALTDLVANTLGTFAGAVVGAHWRALLFPSRRASDRLSVASAGAYLAVIAGLCWALGPSLPEGSWYLERGIGTRLRPSGRVIDARASNEPVVGDTMTSVPSVRRDLLSGARVSVTAAVAPGPGQATSLIQIITPSLDNVITIDRRGDDAAFFSRMRASALRLQRVGVKLPAFFASSIGDTVRLSGARVGPRLEISGARNGRSSANALLLTPAMGWALFVPVPAGLAGPLPYAGVAWTIALLLPFAYWAAWSARHAAGAAPRTTWHLTRVVVVVAAVGVIPLATQIAPGRWWEWGAGLVALLIGDRIVAAMSTDGSGRDYLSPAAPSPPSIDRSASSSDR
jgi:hypothetical protein